ncbi:MULTISPECIES: sigma-70 family RNA polymerase sigma factor [Actinosynnema]|uniref:sigma-70 family RNA polymerase sigma factor n=1 Tax=Actinosynnema TaxID=40566 RepID=UPI0020A344D2|nr:sigma-70 family RNA polymerase sigma factor [Actinosynnema pretiosum]MCP2099629.1 RNA polymerase sigma factor, sigma-70 family [Actinosynnema pretiosum]
MATVPADVPRPGDAELIESVRGGDVAAYGQLYERHVTAAYNLARQLARSSAEADDLVSEAFSKVLDVLRGGGGPDVAFRAYLLTALRHNAYDKTRRDRKVELSEDVSEVAPEAVSVPFRDTAVAGLERSLAARAFARLPERWQTVLWHTEVEGQSPAEVAPLLGMTANGVSALAYRAREGLKQAYLQVHLAETQAVRCRATVDRLGAWTRAGLSKRETAQVETHLDECSDCRRLAAELADVNGALRAAIAPIVLGAGTAGYLVSSRNSASPTATAAAGGVAGNALADALGGATAQAAEGAGGAAGRSGAASGAAGIAGEVVRAALSGGPRQLLGLAASAAALIVVVVVAIAAPSGGSGPDVAQSPAAVEQSEGTPASPGAPVPPTSGEADPAPSEAPPSSAPADAGETGVVPPHAGTGTGTNQGNPPPPPGQDPPPPPGTSTTAPPPPPEPPKPPKPASLTATWPDDYSLTPGQDPKPLDIVVANSGGLVSEVPVLALDLPRGVYPVGLSRLAAAADGDLVECGPVDGPFTCPATRGVDPAGEVLFRLLLVADRTAEGGAITGTLNAGTTIAVRLDVPVTVLPEPDQVALEVQKREYPRWGHSELDITGINAGSRSARLELSAQAGENLWLKWSRKREACRGGETGLECQADLRSGGKFRIAVSVYAVRAENPASEEPVTEEPGAEEPGTGEPGAVEPSGDEPTAGNPTGENPVATARGRGKHRPWVWGTVTVTARIGDVSQTIDVEVRAWEYDHGPQHPPSSSNPPTTTTTSSTPPTTTTTTTPPPTTTTTTRPSPPSSTPPSSPPWTPPKTPPPGHTRPTDPPLRQEPAATPPAAVPQEQTEVVVELPVCTTGEPPALDEVVTVCRVAT